MTDASNMRHMTDATGHRTDGSGEGRIRSLAPQRTIRAVASATGIGLHSGQPVTVTLVPALAGTGIVFRRVDLPKGAAQDLPVRADRVLNSPLCTTLTNEHGVRVSTIEHLMAALSALSIDNLIVEVNAPELPIMDGSAHAFLDMIDWVGVEAQAAPRRVIRVLKRVEVKDGLVSAALEPAPRGLSVEFEIDFPVEAIGRQSCRVSLSERQFRHHIAKARTFCLKSDVEKMHAAGLALGGSLDNAIVVDGAHVLNEDGLRFEEEFVRHKALDAIGDLYMAGLPIIGKYCGVRSGHAMNSALLNALLADPSAYVIETLPKTASDAAPAPFKASRHGKQDVQLACA